MWADERDSDVLGLPECRRLLALGAKERLHGHLAIADDLGDPPTVLPLDYVADGPDVVIRVGETLLRRIAGKLVSFQVDGFDRGRPWSVLVRGLAQAADLAAVGGRIPRPRVAEAGDRIVRIRSDVMTGRRLGATPEGTEQFEIEARSAHGRISRTIWVRVPARWEDMSAKEQARIDEAAAALQRALGHLVEEDT